ncbi:hypothetical protein [Chromobacterium subtsugae]|uniref:hypothetical protein n=1 Tax=Chromobacterium subtsugae TaxID=251747 RepID=UPI000A563F91|nr:hypothetical protein [Chromobacterium subtsugae]
MLMLESGGELTRALGRIEGKLDMIAASQVGQSERLDGLDARLRQVEQQAARVGAISGCVVAALTAIAAEMLKRAW